MDELREIQNRRQQQETELATLENAALRQRLQIQLDKLIAQEQEKKEEVLFILSIQLVSFLLILFMEIYSTIIFRACCKRLESSLGISEQSIR